LDFLGSSNPLPEIYNFSGILSINPEENEVFYNYSMIFINYCDGTGHRNNNLNQKKKLLK
jgi:hypothetical protein